MDEINNIGCVMIEVRGVRLSSHAYWNRVYGRLETAIGQGRYPIALCSAPRTVRDTLVAMVRQRLESKGAQLKLLRRLWDKINGICSELDLNTVKVVGREWSHLEDLQSQLARGASKPALCGRIIESGELMSTRIGAAWLARQGLAIRWCDARSWLRVPHEDERPESATLPHPAHRLLDNGSFEATITQTSIGTALNGQAVLVNGEPCRDLGAQLASVLGADRFELGSSQLLQAAFSENSQKRIRGADLEVFGGER